ncbi:MAG TPA: cytochrome c oxidase subunit 3, partial [Candidatus Limnocylindria bacterium]
ASSGTMGLAAGRRSRAWLGLTALLGAGFLAGQALEYGRLLGAGLRPGSEMFGTTFFTLTGLHAVHVLVGLVLLATLFAASSTRPRRVGQTAWEGIAMYWHFVDAVWVVVFSVVYVGTVLG